MTNWFGSSACAMHVQLMVGLWLSPGFEVETSTVPRLWLSLHDSILSVLSALFGMTGWGLRAPLSTLMVLSVLQALAMLSLTHCGYLCSAFMLVYGFLLLSVDSIIAPLVSL